MSLSCSWKGLKPAVNKLRSLARSLHAYDNAYGILTGNWYLMKSQALILVRSEPTLLKAML
jgi:hypothetical protein